MFVALTDSCAFLTSGKTGTRTLLSIPGIQEISNSHIDLGVAANRYRSWQFLSPREALRALEKNIQDRQLYIVVRHPQQRLISGLFEIIAKKTVFVSLSRLKLHKDALADQLYSSTYWTSVIQNCMDILPRINSDVLERLPFWQFHVGNWMEIIAPAQARFPCEIIQLDRLSDKLWDLGLHHTRSNSSRDLALLEGLDYTQIIESFAQGLSHTSAALEFEQYIKSDINLYHSL